MKKGKKIISLAIVMALCISTSSFTVFAKDVTSSSLNGYIYSPVNAKTAISESVGQTVVYPDKHDDTEKVVRTKDVLYDGMYDKDGKLANIDKSKLKKALLDRWSKDSVTNKSNIDNIDMIVNDAAKEAAKIKSGETTVHPLLGDTYSWSTSPYRYSSTPMVTYSTAWVVEDNYRSSVPIGVSYTQSISVQQSVGFTGEADIKVALGFSSTTTTTQTASYTQGVSIPAWTVWATRPYINWNKDLYKGYQDHYFYDLTTGNWTHIYKWLYGENYVSTSKVNQYYSATNSSHSTTASTPMPPTGQP
ncbi:hypothetical protein [Clostridium tagluense]|uniref:hypothetical protein n=1 Tax=Clostridium tagluense TaxID=360422 RepID=UPI001C6F1B9F|nr:hypothetical protein [Clostridium tagluense]MBW9159743.1 hypothetical protein [Clostridium tagluense]WLC68369.1 hypothetical protein KTC93_24830 [Clostridium tagluense]